MTTDEQSIIDLTRQLAAANRELTEAREEIRRAEQQLSRAGIPSSFEDGNSSDDLSFNERVDCLCKAYEREKGAKA